MTTSGDVRPGHGSGAAPTERASALLETLMGRPLVDDPFPLYAELRAIAPVHREPNGLWYVSTFAHSDDLMRSPRFGHDLHFAASDDQGRRARLLSLMFSFDNPPEHTRKRNRVAAPFTASASNALRPRVAALVDELLAPIARGSVVDLDEQLSARLPVLVTCEILGIPAEDRDRCAGWVDQMTSSNQLVLTGAEAARILAEAEHAAQSLSDYFTALIERRRSDPRDDLVSVLARRNAGDDSPDAADEVLATLVLVMAAGFETTRYTITGGLAALADEPQQWAIAQRQARAGELDNDAIEELLRHQGPIHAALARVALVDEHIAGHAIPAGEAVVPLIAAANRDPAVFADPDRLDLTRSGPRPLSLGAGVHHCLGAFLARDEIRLAVGGVLRHFDAIEVVERPVPKGSFNVRGPKGLRVRVR